MLTRLTPEATERPEYKNVYAGGRRHSLAIHFPFGVPQAACTIPSEHDQRSDGRTDNGQANARNHSTDLVGFAA